MRKIVFGVLGAGLLLTGFWAIVQPPQTQALGGFFGKKSEDTQEMREEIKESTEQLQQEMIQNRKEFQNMSKAEKNQFMEQRSLSLQERKEMINQWQNQKMTTAGELATFAGLTQEEIQEQRRSGMNVGEILEGAGYTQDEIDALMLAQGEEKINALLADDKITEEKADTLFAKLNLFIKRFTSRWFPF